MIFLKMEASLRRSLGIMLKLCSELNRGSDVFVSAFDVLFILCPLILCLSHGSFISFARRLATAVNWGFWQQAESLS